MSISHKNYGIRILRSTASTFTTPLGARKNGDRKGHDRYDHLDNLDHARFKR